MAHQALYRVYRPKTFAEVQGQGRVVLTLRESVRRGRISHAYLFSGPRGTGKTSVARILAKAVNCRQLTDTGDPCLVCESCQALERGQHLDVLEIDAASNRGIDEIREIKERVLQQSALARYKVYIIDEVHMLTPEAFNALLKTLEEPPAHVIFILATTEPQKLPVTVLSRCQRYEFERLTPEQIIHRLMTVVDQEAVSADPAALELIAEAADGALRDALSVLDQAMAMSSPITVDTVAQLTGRLAPGALAGLMRAIGEGIEPLIREISALNQAGVDWRNLLVEVARQLRDLLVYRVAGADSFGAHRREQLFQLNAAFGSVDEETWLLAADELARADQRLRAGFPPDLAVQLGLLKVQRMVLAKGEPRQPSVSEREGSGGQGMSSAASPATATEAKRARRDRLLELLKKERPSTHALLQQAEITERYDAGRLLVEVGFQFPAHRALLEQDANRELFNRVFSVVYGEQAIYRLTVGASSDPSAQPSPPLVDEVRAWFGEQAELLGFEDENTGP